MFSLETLVTLLDPLLKKCMGLGDTEANASQMIRRHKQLNSPAGGAAAQSYSTSDAKNTALLTHVSIMIAICGLLFSQEQSQAFVWIYGLEIVAYLLIAICCMRGLMSSKLPNHTEYFADAHFKETLFNKCALWAILLTIILAAAVVFEVISGGIAR